MYKIYINETPLYLMNTEELKTWPVSDKENLIARYPGKPKFLLNYIDMLEKSKKFEEVIIYSDGIASLWKDYKGLYKVVKAAGGLVFNEKEEILLIYRRAFWDLPKGKLDQGETVEAAALREVREETGLNEVELGDFLFTTYHTYPSKKQKRILKPTYWYFMFTRETRLELQTEEDIEKGMWIKIEQFLSENRIVYGNIKDLMMKVLNKKNEK
ncbi:MAG: NUDIX domain-containing protein [Bacteroidetes bacterium]|nr:NUDIX domain-containing protein [Bacteroidota bacterium]